MTFTKRVLPALLAAATVAIAGFAQNAVAASGGYGSSAAAPTIYSKNIWYNVAFPVVGTPASGATVRMVYYSWSYSTPRPSGFVVWLCDNNGNKCSDVTAAASGSVDFASRNIPANQSLRLYSGVSGTGTMSPPYGGSRNVTVNWSN